jgi:hypothetical protein
MTAADIQIVRQAVAVNRAVEFAVALDPLNVSLRQAKEEPIPNEPLIIAEVLASLAQICVQQREHIVELAERVEELEKA